MVGTAAAVAFGIVIGAVTLTHAAGIPAQDSAAATGTATPAASATSPTTGRTATPSATGRPATTPTGESSAPAATVTPAPRVGAPIASDDSLVTIGDSIMAGYGLDDSSTAAWPVLLGEQTGAPVTNDSCSGAGFIAVGDCGTDYDGLIDQAAAAKPGLVIIQSSDNDLGQDPTALATATTQTVDALHAAVPDARIVGLSTLWDQPGAIPDEVPQSSADLQQAVTAVGGTFVDLGQPIAGQDGLLQSDSEHPTDLGQRALASDVLADLRGSGIES